MIKRKFSIRSISMCLMICLMFIFFGLATTTVAFAAEAETTIELPTQDQLELFTESDFLYDAENKKTNTSYTIEQYDDSLWGVKTGNDDMIVQIVPRECFYNACSFTHIGKNMAFIFQPKVHHLPMWKQVKLHMDINQMYLSLIYR